MAKQLQLRRGTTAEHASFTGAVGEVTVDSDKDTIVVHDGYTVGGTPMLRQDVDNLADQTIPVNKLIKGSAHQALVTNAAGTALEWGKAGSVIQTVTTQDQVRRSIGNIYRAAYNYGEINLSLTRQRPNSYYLISFTVTMHHFNHCSAAIQYSYDNSSFTPLTAAATGGGVSGAGLSWSGDTLYQYPLIRFLHNDSGDSNFSDTKHTLVRLNPTAGTTALYLRPYVWAENDTQTMVLNGNTSNSGTHGSVGLSGLTIWEMV